MLRTLFAAPKWNGSWMKNCAFTEQRIDYEVAAGR
jgi:hypothetical protein